MSASYHPCHLFFILSLFLSFFLYRFTVTTIPSRKPFPSIILSSYFPSKLPLSIVSSHHPLFLSPLSSPQSPDQLHHMTTQISPSLLTTHNIPIFQMKHQPGTFLVTFPKAYHAGFSYGFNVGEAVNFATYDWLSMGGEAEERYRTFARNSVFSHQRLLFTLLHHKADMAPQYHAK